MRNLLLLFICILLSFSLYSQDSVKTEVKPFKLSELSQAIEETDKRISMKKSGLASADEIQDLFSKFKNLKTDYSEMRLDTSDKKWNEVSLIELRTLSDVWTNYQEELKIIDERFSSIIGKYEALNVFLEEYDEKWGKTAKLAESEGAIDVVKERIESIREMIQLETDLVSERTDLCYVLSDSVTQEKLFVQSVISRIRTTIDVKKDRIFIQDSPDFPRMIRSRHDSLTMVDAIGMSYGQIRTEAKSFIQKNTDRVKVHFGIFLLILLLFYYIKWRLKQPDLRDNALLEFDVKILRRPFLMALLISMTLSFWYYPDRPRVLMELLLLFIAIPAIWVLHDMIRPEFRKAMIFVAVIYFLEQVTRLSSSQIYAQRWLLMIESSLGLVFGIYFSRPSSIIYRYSKLGISKLFPIIPLLFGISIYSNYNGGFLLAKILTSSIATGAAAGVVLYLFVSVLEGFIEFLLNSKLRNVSNLLTLRESAIRSWSRIIIRIWATYVWFRLILVKLQLIDPFISNWEKLMTTGWKFGEIELTVQLVVNFLLIIFAFSVIANIIRSLLEVEILPRFNLKKGIPLAIGTVTRYSILILGFFMAVAAAGISLDKLGFIAGALGVGIGFGLQNIVGNFVSGLVLIFERPIHIDDVIVAGTVEGVVKEVGIRSSKIRTWDGAEVIVPNMDLISKQVTNWTLSDTKRRREQLLQLEFGTDPNKVIEVIKEVLEKNEEVLSDPPPMVLYLGYMQYSMDFRVLYWLCGNLLQAGSNVSLEIYNVLKRNKIEVAVPKQRMFMQEDKLTPKRKSPSTKKPRQSQSDEASDSGG